MFKPQPTDIVALGGKEKDEILKLKHQHHQNRGAHTHTVILRGKGKVKGIEMPKRALGVELFKY